MMKLRALDPQPSLLLDADGSVIEANAALLELRNGDEPGAVESLLPVNVKTLVHAALKQSRAIEGVQSRTRERVLEWTFIPDTTSSDVVARARDTTHETALLDEATRASRLYRLIIENTTDLISRHAPCGRFIDASPASARLLGYRPEELRNQPASLLMDLDSASISCSALSHQLIETGYATLTIRLHCKNGKKRWVEVASRAIRETYTGEIIEVIAITRDITERKLREAEQRRHQEELAHTTRLATLGELASGIAHEMNQPLASITNYANASQRYLQRLPSDSNARERVGEGLEHIQAQADHAARVIKRLRNFLQKNHPYRRKHRP
jgi:PAS domain S-box-containing protein